VPALQRFSPRGIDRGDLPPNVAAPTDFDPGSAGSPQDLVDLWVKRLIQRPIDADKKQVLVEAMGDGTDANSVRKVVQLIVSMPEYQLC